MPDSSLYLYPNAGGALWEIQLPADGSITHLDEVPRRDVVDGVALDGTFDRTVLGGGIDVRLVIERWSGTRTAGKALYRDLMTLLAHLERGGMVGLAGDRTKTVMRGAAPLPLAGDTTVALGSNVLSSWNSSASLAAEDEVWLESASPEGHRELRLLDASGTGSITLDSSSSVVYDYGAAPAWVRHRDFWPALYWPAEAMGGQPLTSNGRRTYTLDLTLRLDMSTMAALVDGTQAVGGLTSGTQGLTLEEVRSSYRATSDQLGEVYTNTIVQSVRDFYGSD